ncbi:hypothetical protein ABC502_05160 [Alkalimonas sp. NCh-2]|uniref:hypothetical protein n=1 Tax=Alkalimonas sp. NCh-2 TaxID=3144846 RepID=UPI0031F6C8C7
MTTNQLTHVGLLPVSLDPRLIDSHPTTRIFQRKDNKKYRGTTLYKASSSYGAVVNASLLTQLQSQITTELHSTLAKAPQLNNQLPWDREHKPDIFWGSIEQFRFIHGTTRYNYLDCAFPTPEPCTLKPMPVSWAWDASSAWQLEGYLTAQATDDSRYLLVMNWNPQSSIFEREDRFNLDIKPTRRLLGALSDELGVSHWLMLQLSVADFDQWLEADAHGDYQHDFVLQALLLDTAGRVQQAKISPFTLRWNAASMLLSEDELQKLQPAWQAALVNVLTSFGLMD